MVSLTWVILWAVAGWLIGILLFFIGGLVASPLLSYARRTRVADYYSKVAMKLIDRAVLVERGTKYDIYKSSHDPEKNADTFTLDGEVAHVTNDTGLLSTLHKQPLGLVPPPDENVASYVSPEIAEFGRVEAERKENGELRDSDGYIPDVEIDYRRPLVHLRDYARRMIPGNRSLYDLDETVDLYKQSQSLFGKSKTTQFMILVIAYCAAMGAMWFMMSQGGGGGGGGVPTVPVPPMG